MKHFYKIIPILASSMVVACAGNAQNVTHVESVSLNTNTLTLEAGSSFQLSATIEPEDATNKNVTWSSDNEEYVTVSETGLVSALKAGSATVTVTTVDKKLKDTCVVTVNPEVVLSSISLSNKKTDYLINEQFVKPTVTARFSNATTQDVTSEATFTGYNLAEVGNQTVEVSYTSKGVTKTDSYEITVKYPKKLESITLTDIKTDYFVGDSLVKPTVTALYDDESSEVVTNKAIFSGFNSSSAGSKTVNVSYAYEGVEKTSSYNVTVTALEVESIALSNVTTNYNVGGTFVRPTVTATYNNGSTQNVTNSATFDGYDLSAAGTQVVTVTYGGASTTYRIVVSETPVSVEGDYELFTDSELEIGSYLVFANAKSGSAYAMTTTQNLNNRSSSSVSVSNNIITATSTIATILVEEGTAANTYALYDEVNGGYLYAAGSSSDSSRQNYLRLASSKSSDTNFTFSNNNGQATFKCLSSAARKYLKFNSTDKIFACYKSDSRNTAFPYIFAKSGTPIYATSITLNGSSEVAVNESITLSVGYTPENTNQKKVTWVSSNPSVATVNAGVVSGLSAGTTTITATVLGENDTQITATKEITVKTISVSGVSLNKSSAELSLGRTLQLNATVTPSNATNKNVTWSSSDTSIAVVNNNGLVTASESKTGTVRITVTTVDGSKTATCDIEVKEQTKDAWTILIYMCGSDLESGGGYATSDLTEILSVSNQPDDVNIVIETGGASSWRKYNISSSYLERYHVSNKSLVKDASLSSANMGLSSTLQSFLEYGLTTYPAEKTGLIFWNHGGAMRGVCYDEKYSSDCLTNSEVKTALANAFNSTGRNSSDKLEWVGYDACLMQVQDIAEFNSQYFNYMVASEESEAGNGWEYNTWVDDLYADKPTETILTAIVDGFISSTNSSSWSGSDQTLSWLNLSYMSAYKAAWEAMAVAVKPLIASKTSFQTIMKKVKYYGTDYECEGYSYFGIFDAKDTLNKLKSNYSGASTQIDAALAAFNNLVGYNKTGSAAGNSYGLCCFFPMKDGSGYTCSTSTYYSTSQTNFSSWREIVTTYGD